MTSRTTYNSHHNNHSTNIEYGWMAFFYGPHAHSDKSILFFVPGDIAYATRINGPMPNIQSLEMLVWPPVIR